MRKTTQRNSSDSLMLSRPYKRRLDRNQLDRENSFPADNLLDSEMLFDSAFLLDFEDSSGLEDLFDLKVLDLHWDDEQTLFQNSELGEQDDNKHRQSECICTYCP